MLRERSGKRSAWPEAHWGLGTAWLVISVVLSAELAGVWYFYPELLRSWHAPAQLQVAAAPSDRALLGPEFVLWGCAVLALALAVWRARAWRILGPGEWSWGKAIGLALAGTLVLRIGLLAYTAIWPQVIANEMAAGSPTTRQLALALLKHTTPLGLILVLAVLVPVLEELLFRRVLLQAIARHIPFGWANAFQAVLFAAVHENLSLFPFFFSFALICGLLARRAGALASAIGLHACNNLLVCFALILTNR